MPNQNKFQARNPNKLLPNVNRLGFTLVELLVVMGILGVIIASTLLFLTNILKGSNQSGIISEVRQNGQTVLDVIDRQIRNADFVEDYTPAFSPPLPADAIRLIIPNSAESVYIACFNSDLISSPKKNGWIGIYTAVSAPGSASSFISLTNQDTASGIDIKCSAQTFSFLGLSTDAYPQVVNINFSAQQGVEAPGRIDFKAISEFRTTISLRNYSL